MTIAIIASLLGGLAAPPAGAKRVFPTAEQVRRAKLAAVAKAAQVTAIRARLAAAAVAQDVADLALSTATEDYDQARVELDQRSRATKLAQADADRADRELAAARADVGRLAGIVYREGGDISALNIYFASGGPGEVLDRAALEQSLSLDRQRTLNRMDATASVAAMLERQAQATQTAQQAAASALEAARVVAQRAAATAQAVLASTRATQASLLVQLAALQRTSVVLERRRQAGLEAQRQAALEAARRVAALRRAREEAAQRARDRSGRGGSTGGTGYNGWTPPGTSSGSGSAGRQAVSWAERQVGLPYEWAADGPGSYDCSGLTMRAWQQAGVFLPHSSRAQYQQVAKVSYQELRPGDLLFYATDTSNPGSIHHVALYAGGGMMVEAPQTGLDVRVVPMRWGGAMPYAGRP